MGACTYYRIDASGRCLHPDVRKRLYNCCSSIVQQPVEDGRHYYRWRMISESPARLPTTMWTTQKRSADLQLQPIAREADQNGIVMSNPAAACTQAILTRWGCVFDE
jgi:hypothetical protein